MKVYCISEFKEAFEKLSLKNPYRTLERDIIDYFFDKTVADLRSGVLLNNNYNEPYIKKRLNGRGGFRVYYLLIIKNDCLYLMYLHPKAGPDGADNIKDSFKAEIYKTVLKCIAGGDIFEMVLTEKGNSIAFKKLS